MKIRLLVVDFHLPGCRSLKEKRHRTRGIRDRFGRQPNLALAESAYQNEHQRAQWAFIILASDSKTLDRTVSDLEDRLETTVDGVIGGIETTNL